MADYHSRNYLPQKSAYVLCKAVLY